jgi:hypothetical protein
MTFVLRGESCRFGAIVLRLMWRSQVFDEIKDYATAEQQHGEFQVRSVRAQNPESRG